MTGKTPCAACALVLCTIALSPGLAALGDPLFVTDDGSNVRAKPNLEAPVLLQVDSGRELFEIGRHDGWVQVGILRTGGITGWIRADLISQVKTAAVTPQSENPAFVKFRAAFDILNARVVSQLGRPFFTSAEDLGDGVVELTATDVWIDAPIDDRQGNLDTLFELWSAADGTGMPVSVRVIDSKGSVVMVKSR